MKANELRLGNFVYDEADMLVPIHIVHIEEDNTSWLRPIPLTKEWLLKFGFEEPKHTPIYSIEIKFDSDFIDYLDYNLEEKTVSLSYDFCGINCFYVHQLQNLYFALTGEELPLKDKP